MMECTGTRGGEYKYKRSIFAIMETQFAIQTEGRVQRNNHTVQNVGMWMQQLIMAVFIADITSMCGFWSDGAVALLSA